MNKTVRVIRQELYATFQRKTYLAIAFGIPILIVLILAGVRLIQGRTQGNDETTVNAPVEFHMEVEGFVDHSGLVRVIPSNIPENHLVAFGT